MTPIWIECSCWAHPSIALVEPKRYRSDREAIAAWVAHWKTFLAGGPRYWLVHGPSGHLLSFKEIDFVIPEVAAAHPVGCGRCAPAATARSSAIR